MREHNLNTLAIQSQHYVRERRIERTRDRLAETARPHGQEPWLRARQLARAVAVCLGYSHARDRSANLFEDESLESVGIA